MASWRKQQKLDPFFRKAKTDNYRARSAYKLIEIIDKYRCIKSQDKVLDLGCAPGSWLQVITKYTRGWVGGIDKQYMTPLEGVHFFHNDINNIQQYELPKNLDVITSDMCPNTSGHHILDHHRSIELVRAAYSLTCKHLNIGGWTIIKVLNGPLLQAQINDMKVNMKVFIYKPKATIKSSTELYIIGQK